MAGVINRGHIRLSDKLAGESNRLLQRFSVKNYSRIGSVDKILLKRDISVGKKKEILIKKLHESIVVAFSIDKKKFGRSFGVLEKRIHSIRKIIAKLRSINYYLEAAFAEETSLSRKSPGKSGYTSRQQHTLARDELEALEYTAYRLIGEAVVLDKRLLKEYRQKEKKVLSEEKTEARDILKVLARESVAMEHLEAKMPPPRMASPALLKDPNFTNWVSRVFSLLSYIEHLYSKEKYVFGKLKNNMPVKIRIGKKITQLLEEKSRLIEIMEEKAHSMERLDAHDRKELHSLTTTINL
ncbi:hypothetical protein HYX08_03295 [Candidatus Woesearchaeota archaeon]|nr:hypothetical protein [Candidatus Woesearchaeota archaeon]